MGRVQGWLHKKPEKGLIKKWRKRWFVLDNGCLSYYKSDSDSSPIDSIDVKKITEVRQGKTELLFEVVVPGRVYFLQAASEKAHKGWMEQIKLRVMGLPDGMKNDEKKVDVSNKELEEFPMFTTLNKCLIDLNAAENSITVIPPEVGQIKTLEKLNLSYNDINTMSDEIGNLEKLKELNLHKNQLTDLPETLKNLNKLVLLWVSNNKLKEMPSWMGSLVSLQKLNVAYNSWKIIPDSIGELKNLRNLDLSGNKLKSLPASICSLNIEVLECFNNKLESIPEDIGQMEKLQVLKLGRNMIAKVPDSIGDLTELQVRRYAA
eukprot:CAMPEP_0168521224 /NCGR_PEP_ID=MMETSP0405-20121227/8525_1 /TAXON_ID=498012 /ORGANISM="Trichosphaerium sp, Strain Am-I-7 wt" /LENGTH=318 /DNA_ID=CAMNT_0008542395 /DNA_START=26 /DNA_END=982 /DNA_ORIENTATION=-